MLWMQLLVLVVGQRRFEVGDGCGGGFVERKKKSPCILEFEKRFVGFVFIWVHACGDTIVGVLRMVSPLRGSPLPNFLHRESYLERKNRLGKQSRCPIVHYCESPQLSVTVNSLISHISKKRRSQWRDAYMSRHWFNILEEKLDYSEDPGEREKK